MQQYHMDLKLAETIEKYHQEYDKNPKSKIFAPLADSYRKLGEHNHALVIAKNGTKSHPKFASGHVVLGRIYKDTGQSQKAIQSLETACKLDSNNILAHKVLADLYLSNQEVKKALTSYKMVLFLKPRDELALERVRKLETLTADEFDQDSFKVKKLKYESSNHSKTEHSKLLSRSLSLADAFLVRNEIEKCFKVLNEAKHNLGEHPEIIKRLQLIDQNIGPRTEDTDAQPLANRKSIYLNENIDYLKNLLDQVKTRKK